MIRTTRSHDLRMQERVVVPNGHEIPSEVAGTDRRPRVRDDGHLRLGEPFLVLEDRRDIGDLRSAPTIRVDPSRRQTEEAPQALLVEELRVEGERRREAGDRRTGVGRSIPEVEHALGHGAVQ